MSAPVCSYDHMHDTLTRRRECPRRPAGIDDRSAGSCVGEAVMPLVAA